jgi:hypothetical protein
MLTEGLHKVKKILFRLMKHNNPREHVALRNAQNKDIR